VTEPIPPHAVIAKVGRLTWQWELTFPGTVELEVGGMTWTRRGAERIAARELVRQLPNHRTYRIELGDRGRS
jgi:hypothetical protein